ncbi:MAG: ABC transporter permease, partial [Gammaproteobacteria bacterium]
MMPVLFITDGLIFLLLAMIFSFVWYARGQEHLRAPWRLVARNSMAMASAVILFFYILIGVMDSIHFHPELENVNNGKTQYSTEILSLLDVAITHLRAQDEKTYSAPFASHAYSKETIELSDGATRREFPRLDFGGAHLSDPEQEKTGDILLKSVVGVICGLIVWCLISSIIVFTMKFRYRLSLTNVFYNMLMKDNDVPWKVIHVTIGSV